MAGVGEAFKRLHALGAERVAQIDEMLLKGIPASQVAMVLHGEWKVLTDVKADSVKKMLERYRKTELRARIVHQVAGVTQGLRASTLQKRLNAMDELEALVRSQKDRFEKMYMKEKPTPLLMKQVTDEGRLLKEMLVELGRLQLETGVLQRAPKKISGTLTDEHGVQRAFEWTTEQEALFQQIEAIEHAGLAN